MEYLGAVPDIQNTHTMEIPSALCIFPIFRRQRPLVFLQNRLPTVTDTLSLDFKAYHLTVCRTDLRAQETTDEQTLFLFSAVHLIINTCVL